jgi:hypothetical protein
MHPVQSQYWLITTWYCAGRAHRVLTMCLLATGASVHLVRRVSVCAQRVSAPVRSLASCVARVRHVGHVDEYLHFAQSADGSGRMQIPAIDGGVQTGQ